MVNVLDCLGYMYVYLERGPLNRQLRRPELEVLKLQLSLNSSQIRLEKNSDIIITKLSTTIDGKYC